MNFIRKKAIKILFIASSYVNSFLELEGVEFDKQNLSYFCKKLNIDLEILDNSNKNNIEMALINTTDIIWMGGHGAIEGTCNVYYLSSIVDNFSDSNSKIYDYEFARYLEKFMEYKNFLLILTDFCYSATFINLPYYYDNETFYKKISDKEYEPHLNNKLVICVSAATDYDTTSDTSRGGKFTSVLIKYFNLYGKINLKILGEIKEKNETPVIISVSKIINPENDFIILK